VERAFGVGSGRKFGIVVLGHEGENRKIYRLE
jgi:hypothetical protein